MTHDDFLQKDEKLQYCLGGKSLKDWYVDQYHFFIDLPWLIIDLKFEIFLLYFRFLAYLWTRIEVNGGGGVPWLFRSWHICSFILTVNYSFEKSAISTSENLGKLILGWVWVRFRFIYYSIVRFYWSYLLSEDPSVGGYHVAYNGTTYLCVVDTPIYFNE